MLEKNCLIEKRSLKVANHGSAFTISGTDINLMKIIKTRGVLFVRIKYIYVDSDTPCEKLNGVLRTCCLELYSCLEILTMREIVHLQAGQCGNQIGAKVRFR